MTFRLLTNIKKSEFCVLLFDSLCYIFNCQIFNYYRKKGVQKKQLMKKRRSQKMAGEKSEEFTLEADSELRFEIETKNKKVTVEVSLYDEHLIKR